jgi:hypothetical protein
VCSSQLDQRLRVSDSKTKDHNFIFTPNFDLLQGFAFKIAVKKKKALGLPRKISFQRP